MTTDSQIIEKIQSGELKQAFGLLMEKYNKRLYWHVREMVFTHEDTDDILQNTLIKVWNGLKNFRGDSAIYTWLYRIATNEALNFLKRESINNKLSLSFLEQKIANSVEVTDGINPDTIQAELQKEIAALPDKQRAIFSLRYFQELDYKEIGKILKISPDSAKVSYSVAYKKIEEALKKKF